jgi:threonine dehydratase
MRSQQNRPAAWKIDVLRRGLAYYQPWWRAHKTMAFVPWHTAAYTEAFKLSQEWEAMSGAMRVHAYDTPETILGAGTTGAEFLDQAGGPLDTVLAGVGGGGLLAGIAVAVGGARGRRRRAEGAPTMTYALKAASC